MKVYVSSRGYLHSEECGSRRRYFRLLDRWSGVPTTDKVHACLLSKNKMLVLPEVYVWLQEMQDLNHAGSTLRKLQWQLEEKEGQRRADAKTKISDSLAEFINESDYVGEEGFARTSWYQVDVHVKGQSEITISGPWTGYNEWQLWMRNGDRRGLQGSIQVGKLAELIQAWWDKPETQALMKDTERREVSPYWNPVTR